MANSLITPEIIAKEALAQLENNLVFANIVHREYKDEFAKVGSSISIRRPVHFEATDGATLVKQDVEEGSVTLTVDKRKHVSWGFSTDDKTLTIENYSERYIKPAAMTLAHAIDKDVADLYSSIYHFVGTPNTTPANFSALSDAARVMDDGAVPDDGMRYLVVNPEARYAIANSLTTTYVSDKAKKALERAYMGPLAGFNVYASQHIRKHTAGGAAAVGVIDGNDQSTTYASSKSTWTQTLTTDGWTANASLKAGDTFTIDDVYAANPRTGDSTGELQVFVIVEDKSANGTTTADTDITISPPIITSGPYKTVTAAPADGATITMKIGTAGSAYPQNMAFHKNALALVMCPLEHATGAVESRRITENGYSIRVIEDYDIVNDENIIRLDVLYGTKVIDPRLAVRLTG